MLDVTCLPKNGKTYNGTTKKYGVTIDGVDHIVKFRKEGDDDTSVYCEYVASALFRGIGVPCHEVSLATCGGDVVDLIRDFTSGLDVSLHSYKDTKQSSEDTDIGSKEYTYEDILYLIDRHLKMTEDAKEEAKGRFWDMFICDAIAGNRDRHWGNWGYLSTGQGYVAAPLYDNGACFFPGVSGVLNQYMDRETRRQFLYDRVYVFPASLFRIRKTDRSYRSNYANMFSDLSADSLFEERVVRIRKQVSSRDIFEKMWKICETVPLPAGHRRFYIEIATLRYMCIVLRMDFGKSYGMLEEALRHYG